MCYAVYGGNGETCWCWDATPESNSWVMKSLTYKHWTMKYWSYVLNSEVSTNGVFLWWRLVYVTFGCVTLPRRFRLGIVFGGEVWRSSDSPSFAANWGWTSLAADLFTYLLWLIYMFSFAFWSILGVDSSEILMVFRSHVGLAVLARNCFVCSGIDFSRSWRTI